MTGIAVIIGRCVAGCLGATLIYSALFLYKEEEGGLENRLEQWWQRIRGLHAHAISRETAFLKVVADITSKGFAKLFGERLFGLTAVAASICYSQAATFLLMLFDPRMGIQYICGTLFLAFLLLGSLGPSIERQSQKRLWLSSVLIATVSWPIVFMAVFSPSAKWVFPPSAKFLAWQGYYEGLTILIGVVCDFLFIALTRMMLAQAAQSNSFIKIAGLAIGNACLATLLFIAPLVGSFQLSLSPPAWLAANTLYLVGATNFFDALVSLSWCLIAIIMLLHRLFWPLIERPIYALFRHRIFSEQKKLVFLTGVALLGLAVPSVGRILETLAKAVHS